MKIVLIGGGSYVFAPTVLEDAIVKHRLNECELVLVDLNTDVVEAMKNVGLKMASDLGVKIRLSATNDRLKALPGADFVIVSASVQGARRWKMDYEILKEAGIPDQARECGGVGGLLDAFRSITLIMNICRDMENYCPNAMLLDVTNPMPRVVTAVNRYTSFAAAGFCNIAWGGATGYEWLAKLVNRDADKIKVTTAGLNHFAWLVDIHDRQTGEDLYMQVKDRIIRGEGREFRVLNRWLDQYGGIATGHVDHHGEYLPFDPEIHYADAPPFHGDEAERKQRFQQLVDIGAGKADWRDILLHGSWEHPIDVAAAINAKDSKKFDILNIPNKGYLSQLPEDRIVEVPVIVESGEVKGVKVPDLPEGVAKICNTVSDVHELAAEAAVKGDRRIAERAIEIDPAVTDKKAALSALDKALKAHADILPQFWS